MAEGPLILALLLRAFRFEPAEGPPVVPVAQLTVRSRDGIRLRITPRDATSSDVIGMKQI